MARSKQIEFLNNVNELRGKPNGWPGSFEYDLSEHDVSVRLIKGFESKDFRRLDSWGLAFLEEASRKIGSIYKVVKFIIDKSLNRKQQSYLESLRRRLSYLAANNDMDITLIVDNDHVDLYDKESLILRPGNEVVHDERNFPKDNTPGNIEKDFQTFLYNEAIKGRQNRDYNSNERLGVLGSDFAGLNKKNFGIMREFPTGVFDKEVAEDTRITPTDFIDLVSLNKWGELCVIELKLNDSQLEVVSQLLDYALFFRAYQPLLKSILDSANISPKRTGRIICYVANNYFHPKFDSIKPYYSSISKNWGFEIRQIVMGETRPL